MPKLEQLQKSTKRRERGEAASTFPEEYQQRRTMGGGDPEIDDMIERIDRELSDVTARALGRSADTDHE